MSIMFPLPSLKSACGRTKSYGSSEKSTVKAFSYSDYRRYQDSIQDLEDHRSVDDEEMELLLHPHRNHPCNHTFERIQQKKTFQDRKQWELDFSL
jgi:hypothetical protein